MYYWMDVNWIAQKTTIYGVQTFHKAPARAIVLVLIIIVAASLLKLIEINEIVHNIIIAKQQLECRKCAKT